MQGHFVILLARCVGIEYFNTEKDSSDSLKVHSGPRFRFRQEAVIPHLRIRRIVEERVWIESYPTANETISLWR